jgi:hypothetical protein
LETFRSEEHTLFTGSLLEMNPGFTWIIQVTASGRVPVMMSLKESVIKFGPKN